MIGRTVEKSFAVLALLVFAGAVWPLLGGTNDPESLLQPAKSMPELRLVTYPVYAGIAILAIAHARQVGSHIRANWMIILLVALAIASSLWSIDPGLTLRRSAVLAVTTVFGLYLVSRFAPQEIMRLLVLSFSIAGVLSLLLVLIEPDLAIEVDARGPALRGVFVQKNVLGEFMLFGAAAALVLAASQARRNATYLLMYAFAMVLTVLSNSATYIVIGILMVPVVAIAAIRRRLSKTHALAVAILAIPILLLLVALMASEPDAALGLLARERTFTGRTDVWELAWEYVLKRFWLGYGYGAFWDGWMAPGYDIRSLIGAYPHAHNGWLDLWLSIGVIGVAVMAISFLSSLIRAIKNLVKRDELRTMAPLIFLLAILFLSPVENGLLIQNTATWVLYVVASASTISTTPTSRIRRTPNSSG